MQDPNHWKINTMYVHVCILNTHHRRPVMQFARFVGESVDTISNHVPIKHNFLKWLYNVVAWQTTVFRGRQDQYLSFPSILTATRRQHQCQFGIWEAASMEWSDQEAGIESRRPLIEIDRSRSRTLTRVPFASPSSSTRQRRPRQTVHWMHINTKKGWRVKYTCWS